MRICDGRTRSEVLGLLVVVAILFVSSAGCAMEFIANGALGRALAGGARCETSANAFTGWTLSNGGTWYDDDKVSANSMGCLVACGQAREPQIVQSFAMQGNLPYTLSFWHKENQWPNPGPVAWNQGCGRL